MMLEKVLVTGTSIRPELLKPLEEAGLEVVLRPDDMNEEQLVDSLQGCSGYILGGQEKVTKRVLRKCPELKTIAFYGMGYSLFIDEEAAKECGVTITNTPGTLGDSVAEFCVSQLISVTRKLFSRVMTKTDKIGFDSTVNQLTGSKVGIVGMGDIGSRVSKILRHAFNCDVYYYSRTVKPDIENRDNATFVSLEDMFGNCDAVLFCVEKNSETIGMFNWKLLENIKRPVNIVNISSPYVLDSTAVLLGLQEGKIETISYDVFYSLDEPGALSLFDFDAERVVITKHVGSLTHAARDAMAKKCVENILDKLSDQIAGSKSYRIRR